MIAIGTVLPTRKSLEINDKYATQQAAMKESVARAELAHCERRVIGGEVRYYDTTDQYAIVSRQGRVMWFAVTPDGDFRI